MTAENQPLRRRKRKECRLPLGRKSPRTGLHRPRKKPSTEGDGGFNGGRRGFQPPHRANKMGVGFSRGRTTSSNCTQDPTFFRTLSRPAVLRAPRPSKPNKSPKIVAPVSRPAVLKASWPSETSPKIVPPVSTGSGKTLDGGSRGFQPPHRANKMGGGFSRGRTARNAGQPLRDVFRRARSFVRQLGGW